MHSIKKGFTLIELLVVIAIIAILAAILFPVFAQAKAAAKKTTVVSNTKQILTANVMYEGDHDDTFALGRAFINGPANPWITFIQTTQPYTKVREFDSPDNPLCGADEATCNKLMEGLPNDPKRPKRGYGANPRLMQAVSCEWWLSGCPIQRGISATSVDAPAQKILIAENRGEWPDVTPVYQWGEWPVAFYNYVRGGKQSVYGFVDGHAKSMRPTATTATFNMWGGMVNWQGPEGSACGDDLSVNCDKPEPGMFRAMKVLEDTSAR